MIEVAYQLSDYLEQEIKFDEECDERWNAEMKASRDLALLYDCLIVLARLNDPLSLKLDISRLVDRYVPVKFGAIRCFKILNGVSDADSCIRHEERHHDFLCRNDLTGSGSTILFILPVAGQESTQPTAVPETLSRSSASSEAHGLPILTGQLTTESKLRLAHSCNKTNF